MDRFNISREEAMDIISISIANDNALTEEAKAHFADGGIVQMETDLSVWITIHNPMFLEGKNFRPFKLIAINKEVI